MDKNTFGGKKIKSKKLNNKNALTLIADVIIEFGFPQVNIPLLKTQMFANVQLLVPSMQDKWLMEQSLRYNLQVWLKSKNKEKPDEIPYQEWLEILQCFFKPHRFWKSTRFIRRHHPTISFYLAMIIPTISTVIAIVCG